MAAINYGTRARLGMLLPSGNQAAEPQFHSILPAGVSLHVTRLPLRGSSERELLAMSEGVEAAAALAADTNPSLIVFHCTAVSTYSPELEQSIKARITKTTGKPATATSEAIVAALRQVEAKRIVMLSPYPDHINDREAKYFKSFGFDIVASAGLNCQDADEMIAVTPEQWQDFARKHRTASADAYLLSCTTVRSVEVAAALEEELGRPVVTSNTATAWHCLRTMGLEDRIEGYGSLLSNH